MGRESKEKPGIFQIFQVKLQYTIKWIQKSVQTVNYIPFLDRFCGMAANLLRTTRLAGTGQLEIVDCEARASGVASLVTSGLVLKKAI